ncbi:hypothetical protein ACI792_13015 [Blastococcus sp. SYSU DS0669]
MGKHTDDGRRENGDSERRVNLQRLGRLAGAAMRVAAGQLLAWLVRDWLGS